jgi:hypothetical protein
VAVVTVAATKQTWPDVPVLKSDTALELEEEQRLLLAKQAEENPDAIATPHRRQKSLHLRRTSRQSGSTR